MILNSTNTNFCHAETFCQMLRSGWWLVENEDKRLAWFPAPFLELCDEEDDDELTMTTGSQLGGMMPFDTRTNTLQVTETDAILHNNLDVRHRIPHDSQNNRDSMFQNNARTHIFIYYKTH